MTLKKYIGSRSKHFLIIILHTTSTTKVILLINLKKNYEKDEYVTLLHNQTNNING